jgi:hypothetical protein
MVLFLFLFLHSPFCCWVWKEIRHVTKKYHFIALHPLNGFPRFFWIQNRFNKARWLRIFFIIFPWLYASAKILSGLDINWWFAGQRLDRIT